MAAVATIVPRSERHIDPRPHRRDRPPEIALDARQRGGVVCLETQDDDRGGVRGAGEAEAVGVFDAQAVDGDAFAGAGEPAFGLEADYWARLGRARRWGQRRAKGARVGFHKVKP